MEDRKDLHRRILVNLGVALAGVLFLINLSCCYGLEAVLFPLLRFQDQEALKFLHLKKIPRVHIIHPYK